MTRQITVTARYPRDADTVFAEAILNRTPWKMWDLSTGGPAEGADTAEAVALLERAFDTLPGAWNHPGLLHLYVHLMEMSPYPERALRHGDKLRDLVPDAGHLIHMPTHIDVLTGYYRDVVIHNQRASAVDAKYRDYAGPLNRYTGYRIHNFHFAIYGAMFLGQYAPAIAAAEAADRPSSVDRRVYQRSAILAASRVACCQVTSFMYLCTDRPPV